MATYALWFGEVQASVAKLSVTLPLNVSLDVGYDARDAT